MKKILTLSISALIFAALATVTSCSKDPLIVTYNFGDKPIDLPANPYNTYQYYYFDVNHTDVMSALTNAGVKDLSRVNTAKVKKMKAVVTTTGANFDEISGVWVYLKSPGTTDDGDMIAYADNMGGGIAEVAMTLSGAEVKKVLTEDMVLYVKVLSGASGSSALTIKLTEGTIEIEAKK